MADNKTNSQKKDEIIAMQLDIIRKMTENNIKRLSDDIWGATRNTSTQTNQTSGTTQKTVNSAPTKKAETNENIPPINTGASGEKTDLTKASDGATVTPPESEEEKLPPKEYFEDLN